MMKFIYLETKKKVKKLSIAIASFSSTYEASIWKGLSLRYTGRYCYSSYTSFRIFNLSKTTRISFRGTSSAG